MKVSLNKNQKLVLLFGLVLAVLSELFPHWVYFDSMTSGHRPIGYRYYANPPQLKSPEEMLKLYPNPITDDDFMRYIRVEKDGLRTLLQRAFLLLFICGLLITFKRNLSLAWAVLAGAIFCLSVPPFYFLVDSLRLEFFYP
mgnify:CR=1 FL=1